MVLLYGAVFAILGGALFWQLSTLLPGYSASEVTHYQASQTWGGILENPLNAPFHVAIKALGYLISDNLITTRLAAAGFGAVTLGAFAIILRRWHGKWTAIIGTLLFGLSAWFLHTSRLGTPDVLLFSLFALTACGFWLRRTNSWAALLVCFLVAAITMYVPGMLWFIIIGLIWQWKTIDAVFKKRLASVSFGTLLLLLALVPLGWAIYKQPALVTDLLGLPDQWPTPLAMLENLWRVPFNVLVRNEANPAIWLGTAPILDVFSLVMFILGGYTYLKYWRLIRTPLFISLFAVTAGLMAIGSPISFTVIMPFIYLVIATGVSRLIDLWLDVFPRNPIARSVGWISITFIVTLACSYHLTHYFIGWPQATATEQVFTLKTPDELKQ